MHRLINNSISELEITNLIKTYTESDLDRVLLITNNELSQKTKGMPHPHYNFLLADDNLGFKDGKKKRLSYKRRR